MQLKNFKGVFDTIEAVYEEYPQGGTTGDYIILDGRVKEWNLALGERGDWDDPVITEQTPVRTTETIYGDLEVHHDLTVGGILNAKLIRGRNAFRGVYADEASLNRLCPNPSVGEWAMVFAYTTVPPTQEEPASSSEPAEPQQEEPANSSETTEPTPIEERTVGDNALFVGYIFICEEGGTWKSTGFTGGYDGTFEALQHEEEERKAADNALGQAIQAEIGRAQEEESILQGNINAEQTRAEKEERILQENIDKTRRETDEAISKITPIQIYGNVINAADEEDLTNVNEGDTGVLKFKDRSYNPLTHNGMGKVILRKNIVDGNNILTQDMLYKGEVGSRVPNTKTVFVIRYDYSLNGQTITIPDNCVLEFEGGSLSNGTVICEDTLLYSIRDKEEVLSNILLKGYYRWFLSQARNQNYDPISCSGLGRVYLRKTPTYVFEPWVSVRTNGIVYLMHYDRSSNTLYGIYDSETGKGLILLNNLVTEKENYDPSGLPEEAQGNYLGYTEDDSIYTVTLPDESTITSSELNQTRVYRYEDGGTIMENVLTQNMINKPNTIYHIQYDFDLNGQTITIPENCVLEFEGGSLSNGTVIGNNTEILSSIICLYNIFVQGAFKNNKIFARWFFWNDDYDGDELLINNLLDSGHTIIFEQKNYYFKLNNKVLAAGTKLVGDSEFIDFPLNKTVFRVMPKNENTNFLIGLNRDCGLKDITFRYYGGNLDVDVIRLDRYFGYYKVAHFIATLAISLINVTIVNETANSYKGTDVLKPVGIHIKWTDIDDYNGEYLIDGEEPIVGCSTCNVPFSNISINRFRYGIYFELGEANNNNLGLWFNSWNFDDIYIACAIGVFFKQVNEEANIGEPCSILAIKLQLDHYHN